MKTIFSLLLTAAVVLLWAFPVLTSKEFDAGRFAIDFCIFMGTYLMLVYPELFSSVARRKRQFTSRVPA
ncbi:hypothetical protein EBAPG3_005770 [Nitrosospira lacus]|uniref:Uncharacterized protein n=1 Tax=Nitrosospira lacus TaxID=1288494 RepID=A0A1W6SNE4_9PROT|nr:hypothetical protein [Nitrosospira lacus]ARO87317.1 hypothetical protein EBAPG3_005770 [Nitrosospira lacus]